MSNSIVEAFKKLNASVVESSSDHETIFEVSYQYLSKIKDFDDFKSFKNCLVSLINLDRYHKAFELIEKIKSENIKQNLALEVAYVYYKLGKSRELLELYNNSKLDNEIIKRGLSHILAQNYYKDGEYEKALKIYYELIDINKFDNNLDLVINEKAAISQLNFLKSGNYASRFNRNAENHYDFYFNEALIELSNSNLDISLSLLKKSEDLCLEQNSSLPESELLMEILPIKITLSYIFQVMNNEAESSKVLSSIPMDSVNDTMMKLIIKNNSYSIGSDVKNLNFIERDLEYQPNLHKLAQKLTKFQYQIIIRNNLLLKFTTDTLSKSYLNPTFLKDYLDHFPGDFAPVAYKILLRLDIKFDDLNNEYNHKSISRKIFKFINNNFAHSEEIIVAALILTFLNDKSKNYDQAINVLERLVEIDLKNEKVTPGLVSTLIKVYENLNATKKLSTILDKLVENFDNTSVDILSNVNYYKFVKSIGLKFYNQNNSKSVELIKLLSKIDSNDTLISAIVTGSTERLLPLNTLCSKLTIEELLSTPIESLITTKNKPISKKAPSISKISKNKKAPKFSATKVIKPDSELQLDEERWLPLKLRSYYKPSKKDKKRQMGHQGAIDPSQAPTSVSASVVSSGATNVSKNKNNKKKKKGKK